MKIVNTNIFTYAGLALLLLIFSIPFLQPLHELPLASFYSEWLAFVLGLLALLVVVAQPSPPAITLPKSSLLLFVFAVYIVVQGGLVNSPYYSPTLFWFVYLTWAGALGALAATVRTQLGLEQTAKLLAWFALAGGVLHALMTGYSYLQPVGGMGNLLVPQPGEGAGGSIGQLAQRNQFASHLMLAVIAAGYLYARNQLHAAVAGISITPMLTFLALTGSRSIWIYLIVVTIIAFFYWLSSRKTEARRVLFFCAVIMLAFITLQQLLPEILKLITNRDLLTSLARLQESGISGLDIRIREWNKATAMLLESPLIGVGAGNYTWFSYVFIPIVSGVSTQIGEPVFSHAHNLFFQILAETGLIGFAFLLTYLTYWSIQFLRESFSLEKFLVLAMLMVIFLHSNLEHPLWYSYFLGITAILFGIGDRTTTSLSTDGKRAARYAMGFLALGGLAVAISILTNYQHIKSAGAKVYSADISLSNEDLRMLEKARHNILLAPYADFLAGNIMALDSMQIQAKLDLNTRIMRWRPLPEVAYRQSVLLAMTGRTEEAISQFRAASSKYPHLLLRMNTALRMQNNAEIAPLREEANRILQERGIKPN